MLQFTILYLLVCYIYILVFLRARFICTAVLGQGKNIWISGEFRLKFKKKKNRFFHYMNHKHSFNILKRTGGCLHSRAFHL